ncbi:MAG: carboxymuconolactone decarboxylase family protein [Gemmatimonadota bacterium]|nr:carboxymuconolactone decarboxylase family protein [Gemmatimonadota bacterium]
MSGNATTSLPMLTLASAPPEAHAILERAKHQIGMVPNMYGFMAQVPGLLETYLFGYERFRQESGLTPAEQEVVFLAISRENECDYCMAAHSFLADTQSGLATAVTDAIRDDRTIQDTQLAALAAFARTMVRTRGRPTPQDLEALLGEGYTDRHVFAIILAIGVKTFSNYSNHFAATPLDTFFKGREWTPPQAGAEVGV